MQVTLNGKHRLTVDTAHNLFEIQGVAKEPEQALVSTHSPKSTYLLWHHRFGHASAARMKDVLGDGIELSKTTTCSACMRGKMIKLPFKGSFSPTTDALEIVHADLVGPISPATNLSHRYFLTLVDQHTGYIDITLLKEKSDATTAIIKYKNRFEKQTGKSFKKLISDGGGEFCNGALSEILAQEGIQHNVAPPYTPQHNGIAERANRTIIEMT
jgi:transposase InsO family protein